MNSLVVKANELNETPLYRKSLELKIFSKIITLVRDDPQSNIFTFQIKDLMEDFNGSNENYQYIKKTAKNMMVAEFGDGKKNIILEVIFRKVDITEAGIISFKIDEEFKPYVVGLSKNFTKYYFENIARLNSGFSIRLYEILKQWETRGEKKFSISALRYLLKIPDTKYTKYNNFKQRVLETAEKELREKSDIYFKYESIKTGRKITDIQFYIFKNNKVIEEKKNKDNKVIEVKPKQEEEKQELKIDIDPTLKKELEELKIDKVFIRDIIKVYPVDRIKRNLAYTKKELLNENINSSVGGYFREALKRDYANQPNLFILKAEEKKKAQEQKVKELNKEQYKEQYFEKLKKEFEQAKKELIYKTIENNLIKGLDYYNHFKETRTSSIYKLPNLKSNELMEFVRAENKIETSIFRASFYEDKIEDKIDFIEFGKKRGAIIKKEYDNFVIVDLN
jgi:plasmid replication initiation protein